MIHCTRRDILLGLAGFGLFGAMSCRGREDTGDSPSKNLSVGDIVPLDVFSPEQLPIIAAAVDTILPGAEDAGVPDYIAYWLSRKPFESTRNFITHGLIVLEKQSKKRHRTEFMQCKKNEREEVLREFAEGKMNAGRFNGGLFFQKLAELTIEGFLSDPKYGGNRDSVGWRFIGIPDGLQSCWWNPNGVSGVLDHE